MAQENICENINRRHYPSEMQDWELEQGQGGPSGIQDLKEYQSLLCKLLLESPYKVLQKWLCQTDLSCFINDYAVSTRSFIEYSLQESSVSYKETSL